MPPAVGTTLARGERLQLTTWVRDHVRGADHRPSRVDGLLALGLIVYALAYVSWLILRWGGEDLQVAIADAIYLPLGALVVTIALRAARSARERSVARAWRLFAAAFVAYALADLAWFLIEVVQGRVVPTPSVADIGYLAFYPLMVLGLLALPREAAGTDRTRLLDLAIVCTASLASVWWLVVGPVAASIGSDTVAGLVAVAYPAGDLLVMFALATAMFGRIRSVNPTTLVLLGVGLACNMVADLTYARLALEGTYPTGGWLDVAYTAGWLALGFAGIVQIRTSRASSLPSSTAHLRPIPALPYLATALVFGLLWVSVAESSADQHVLVAGAIAVTALVSLRQFLTARQNTRLLAQRLHSEAALPRDPAQRLGCGRGGRPGRRHHLCHAIDAGAHGRPAARSRRQRRSLPSSSPRMRRSCASCCAPRDNGPAAAGRSPAGHPARLRATWRSRS